MSLVLALVLAQLLPQVQQPACQWRTVPVWCEQRCDCGEVVRRLELAREEITSFWVDCPTDFWAGLEGWTIYITKKPHIPGPKNEVLWGVVVGREKRVVLSRDMRGALHELVHVQELAQGTASARAGLYDHPLWDRDGAIREIDGRFQILFRNRLP